MTRLYTIYWRSDIFSSTPNWQSIVKQVSPSCGRSHNFSTATRWEWTAGWKSRGVGWWLQQEPCCEYALNAAALLLISHESLLIPWKLHGHLYQHTGFWFDLQTLISASSAHLPPPAKHQDPSSGLCDCHWDDAGGTKPAAQGGICFLWRKTWGNHHPNPLLDSAATSSSSVWKIICSIALAINRFVTWKQFYHQKKQ